MDTLKELTLPAKQFLPPADEFEDMISSRHLKSFTLRHCPNLSDEHLKAFLNRDELEELHLDFQDQITDEGLRHLKNYWLSNLSLCRARSITIAGVKQLLADCPTLKVLDLTWCNQFTPQQLDSLEKERESKRPGLTILYAGKAKKPAQQKQVVAAAVMVIPLSCS